jgi:hypothetical protein
VNKNINLKNVKKTDYRLFPLLPGEVVKNGTCKNWSFQHGKEKPHLRAHISNIKINFGKSRGRKLHDITKLHSTWHPWLEVTKQKRLWSNHP